MNANQLDIAIVGAGIVGLAHAYMAANKGYRVGVFERNEECIGASIRNFGMIWPIGQASGPSLEHAKRSREHWHSISHRADFWLYQNGSLHLVYEQDEMDIITEFIETAADRGYDCELVSAAKALELSDGIQPKHLVGALWSKTEMLVEPREVLTKLSDWLSTHLSVEIHYATSVLAIDKGKLSTSKGIWAFEHAFVCCGDEFQSLYPAVFKQSHITKSKLQMMRTGPQPTNFSLGPSLCGGLTLSHYASFSHCRSVSVYKERMKRESPQFSDWGIHVMVSQNAKNELIIGDSHEYGWTFDPFIREEVNEYILNYLDRFALFPSVRIKERWYGVYAKYPGHTEFIRRPEKNVTIVTGLGGAGMTLSFGLAEKMINQL